MKHGKPQMYLRVHDVRLLYLWRRQGKREKMCGDCGGSYVFRTRKQELWRIYRPHCVILWTDEGKKRINVVRKVTASVFGWHKHNNQSSRNKLRENCKLLHEQFLLPKSFLQNISQLCALPGDFYCIYECHHFWSVLRHCEHSDTNICHPNVYQRHHSIPRPVTRLRAIWIRLMDHSAVGRCQELINTDFEYTYKMWYKNFQFSRL